MIFTLFGKTEYNGVLVADIFHNLNYYYNQIKNNFILRNFQVPRDFRPEMLAHQLYGDPNLYFVFFLVNEISDPFNEWIKSTNATQETTEYTWQYAGGSEQIYKHVDEKNREWFNVVENPEGSGNWYTKDRFGNPDRFVYSGTMVPVSVTEEMQDRNEDYRIISIIDPSDIRRFIDSLTDVIGAQR